MAVVDPPREGLHPNVLMAILLCSELKRIAYISCNPESLARNCYTLSRPPMKQTLFERKHHSTPNYKPFTVRRALAFDMFPHTDLGHVESLVLLERR